jgi:hypothetical protein
MLAVVGKSLELKRANQRWGPSTTPGEVFTKILKLEENL